MASQIRRVIFNTRERALSTDFNDMTNLMHRGMVEMLASLSARLSGVVHGMEVSIVGTGLDLVVSRGLAVFNSGGATADDSEFDWIELPASETIAVSTPDGANPRWDVVEIVAADASELSSLRDVFNPALGTFTPQTLEKRRGSDPTISVRAGTPAATPVFPAGVAGAIPLAYVYVPAGVANLAAGDAVRCRPLVAASAEVRVRGGGVEVASPISSLDVSMVEASGVFSGGRQWRVPGSAAFTLSASIITGAAVPSGADDDVHWYVAPPPYPAGYASHVAGREFIPGSGVVAQFNSVVAGVEGCIVFASTDEPDPDTAQGAPTLSTGSITDTLWSGVTLDASNVVYLGTTKYADSFTELAPQRYNGAGEVIMDPADVLSSLAFEINVQNTTSTGSLSYDASRIDPLSIAGATVLPPHAGDVRLRIRHSLTSGANYLVRFFEHSGATAIYESNAVAGSAETRTFVGWVNRTGLWEHSETAGFNSTVNVAFIGYKDLILGRR